ncbi:transcriptional regulator [Kordiimonas sediminis]|uniref:Transcriptional regulator n=1 Tax=Kordiimonas sediminis TaxID=1735581 RepID=A0A919ATI0_9PROT|nr:helix-turn-helix transcriptional regulator [Kordiimonas sediminis]GHF22387.1 transcriptional regulator [Kordiimonas sediminis]
MPDPIDIAVGSKLAEIRKKRGLTQTDLSKEVGLTFQQIQKYEKGHNRISAGKLLRFAKSLNVRVESFFPNNGNLEQSAEEVSREKRELAHAFQSMDRQSQSTFLNIVHSLAHLEDSTSV